MGPLSYKAIRITITKIADRAGIKKRVNPHSFRHLAITHWVLDGYNEQEIKHFTSFNGPKEKDPVSARTSVCAHHCTLALLVLPV